MDQLYQTHSQAAAMVEGAAGMVLVSLVLSFTQHRRLILDYTPFESFLVNIQKISNISGWRQAPCPVERRGVQSRWVNYQVPVLCQAGVGYFQALLCFRLSQNMGLVSSLSFQGSSEA